MYSTHVWWSTFVSCRTRGVCNRLARYRQYRGVCRRLARYRQFREEFVEDLPGTVQIGGKHTVRISTEIMRRCRQMYCREVVNIPCQVQCREVVCRLFQVQCRELVSRPCRLQCREMASRLCQVASRWLTLYNTIQVLTVTNMGSILYQLHDNTKR
jgi:hypothetical protein